MWRTSSISHSKFKLSSGSELYSSSLSIYISGTLVIFLKNFLVVSTKADFAFSIMYLALSSGKSSIIGVYVAPHFNTAIAAGRYSKDLSIIIATTCFGFKPFWIKYLAILFALELSSAYVKYVSPKTTAFLFGCFATCSSNNLQTVFLG